ncbi:response regulator [Gemmata sp. G18]|uniref:Response regulator n=1 Tax=Gemmata palustris TaxID=2822762 RepID=A0ABS5BSM3_9BACT|nr:response regulator [Gemmata palustris]MBP3956412.1 response regulator [Gemmata palustris]
MSTASILLVEDNEDDIALTLRAFRKANIANSVVVARDGVEALDYLFGTGTHAGRDATQLPAVILLDLKLPRVDGLEVLRRLRSTPATRMIRTVILTSSKEEQDVSQSYELGACSYIRKPVDFDKFLHAVSTLGVYWLLLNETPPIPRPTL